MALHDAAWPIAMARFRVPGGIGRMTGFCQRDVVFSCPAGIVRQAAADTRLPKTALSGQAGPVPDARGWTRSFSGEGPDYPGAFSTRAKGQCCKDAGEDPLRRIAVTRTPIGTGHIRIREERPSRRVIPPLACARPCCNRRTGGDELSDGLVVGAVTVTETLAQVATAVLTGMGAVTRAPRSCEPRCGDAAVPFGKYRP